MGNPIFVPEAALQLFQVVLYCMAYIFGGAALIALSVYTVLVCTEMFSQARSKRKVLQPALRVPVAERTLDPSVAEPQILPASEGLAKQPLWVNAPPQRGAQIPMTFRGTLEGGPAEP